jgi:fumarate reductase flavoprotein subunit
MAMALRAGLTLRDMEMVQFHPTGLLAGTHTRMTGTVLEEGLRGAGGYLLDGNGERFMHRYDPRGERATRDIVSRSIYRELRAGKASPNGGVYLRMSHLGPDTVRQRFKGMVERCADCGFDLAGDQVEVVPTAHYMMGGIVFERDCSTTLPGLFVAGEDAGGVHGANRLGGNGVANSTVFGGIAGDTLAQWATQQCGFEAPSREAISRAMDRCRRPLGLRPGNLEAIRESLYELMWRDVGILRDASGLARARAALMDIEGELDRTGVDGGDLRFNLSWHDWMNLHNLTLVSRAITEAAILRENSRGAHYREDFPEPGDLDSSEYVCLRHVDGAFEATRRRVAFTRVRPGQSLIDAAPASPAVCAGMSTK